MKALPADLIDESISVPSFEDVTWALEQIRTDTDEPVGERLVFDFEFIVERPDDRRTLPDGVVRKSFAVTFDVVETALGSPTDPVMLSASASDAGIELVGAAIGIMSSRIEPFAVVGPNTTGWRCIND